VVRNCVFAGNQAVLGGAIAIDKSTPRLVNCTFVDNEADYGPAIAAAGNISLSLENCLIAYNGLGDPVWCFEADVSLTCCNVYGNASGDWVGCLAGFADIDGNFSDNPLFCSTASYDYLLREDSPCRAENNTCNVTIGALDADCNCDCGTWGDVTGDVLINAVDVVTLVGFVYRGQDYRIQPVNCQFEAGDVTCDGQVNPVDVVYYVYYVYKGITSWPCEDPCAKP